MLTYPECVSKLGHYKASLEIPADAELTFVEKRIIELGSGRDVAGPDEPPFADTLAWVGEFVSGFLFWELALDRTGNLIRLRKSR